MPPFYRDGSKTIGHSESQAPDGDVANVRMMVVAVVVVAAVAAAVFAPTDEDAFSRAIAVFR